MKNNNIISLDQWKKRKQSRERLCTLESLAAGSYQDKFMISSELNEKYNTEDEEDCLSGMLIW